MKLVSRDIDRDGSGHITMIPEEPEDLWHVYHLISNGDILRSTTIRKVKSETNTGSVDSQKVRTTLSIQVVSVEFDIAGNVLRVNGRNVEENQFVKMGAFHSIEMELHRKFTLTKQEWDEIALQRVYDACDPAQHADIAAVVMQEGLAHVCLVTPYMTVVRSKIEGLTHFYQNVMDAIVRHVNFDVVKCVLIASPGFVREQFADYMFAQAIRTECKVITENRSKFLLVHSPTGFVHSLKEVLMDPSVSKLLADTKAAGEVHALADFYKMANEDSNRAHYGYEHCARAAALQAVDTLLITDELFRAADVTQRRKYVQLVKDVKDSGGTVKMFSSMHVSGEQLALLSGVAAILRFPVVDEEEHAEATAAAEAPDT